MLLKLKNYLIKYHNLIDVEITKENTILLGEEVTVRITHADRKCSKCGKFAKLVPNSMEPDFVLSGRGWGMTYKLFGHHCQPIACPLGGPGPAFKSHLEVRFAPAETTSI